MDKEYKTPEAQGIYKELKHDCMNNGGTYMAINKKIRAKDLFEMIYNLHIRIYCPVMELHFPPELRKHVVELMQQLLHTFQVLEFKVKLVPVNEGWIPWQIFIRPNGDHYSSLNESTTNVIDIIDPSVYGES